MYDRSSDTDTGEISFDFTQPLAVGGDMETRPPLTHNYTDLSEWGNMPAAMESWDTSFEEAPKHTVVKARRGALMSTGWDHSPAKSISAAPQESFNKSAEVLVTSQRLPETPRDSNQISKNASM